MNQDKTQILQEAANYRKKEILQYQINIDNYKLAIEEIDRNYSNIEELKDFKNHLSSLLKSSIIEQTKEKIMLTVMLQQLGK